MKSSWIKSIALALGCSVAVTVAQPSSSHLPIANGPFVGTMESLTNYSYPKWFCDAKFGIWAHWGPQSVPMEGDWYARKMYQQGQSDYNDHLKTGEGLLVELPREGLDHITCALRITGVDLKPVTPPSAPTTQ